MSQNIREKPARRRRAYASVLGITQLHLRCPLVIAIWSGIFPGMGHLLLGKNIRGCILFIWEVVVNLLSHLNLAILYTFVGNFEMAKQVLNTRWILLYIPTFLFAVWDSYRTAADLNNHFVLAAREDADVQPFAMNSLGINYLDKSSPWTAVFWSMLSPGVGQLIIHHVLVAFFLFIWWIAVAYYSKVLPAIHYTLLGMFQEAKAVVDPQWLLNIPSLFFFAIYDAYVNAVESNKLFEWEQGKFLRKNYQSHTFRMPFLKNTIRRCNMYIVSNFEHTIKIETAITALEMKGIPREDILAVPMDKRNEDRMLFDRIHSSDSLSLLDMPVIMGATFGVFGIIYGFILSWGPIIWALIGTAFGLTAGIIIKLITTRKKRLSLRAKPAEVVLLIACQDTQADLVKDILWCNNALGVAKLDIKDT